MITHIIVSNRRLYQVNRELLTIILTPPPHASLFIFHLQCLLFHTAVMNTVLYGSYQFQFFFGDSGLGQSSKKYFLTVENNTKVMAKVCYVVRSSTNSRASYIVSSNSSCINLGRITSSSNHSRQESIFKVYILVSNLIIIELSFSFFFSRREVIPKFRILLCSCQVTTGPSRFCKACRTPLSTWVVMEKMRLSCFR